MRSRFMQDVHVINVLPDEAGADDLFATSVTTADNVDIRISRIIQLPQETFLTLRR